jgi:uncharacterized protein (TIGR03437 family)
MKSPIKLFQRRFQRRYQMALLVSLLALFGVSISAQRIWEFVPAGLKEKMQSTRRGTDSSASPGKQWAAKPPTAISSSALDPAQVKFAISQSGFPGGGGASSGGAFAMLSTLCQALAGLTSGGNFSASGGFVGVLPPFQCPTITITPATLANGQLGQQYSQQLTQSGGTGAIAWSVSAGSLPNNMTLNPSTGLLSGAPLASGSFPFTVKVTDAGGCVGTQSYTLVIGCSIISFTPSTGLAPATVGVTYTQFLQASGGTPPYSFSFDGSAPAWLSLSANGLLSGQPAAAGAFTFMVKVTDAGGCTGTKSYTLSVNADAFAVSGRVIDPAGRGIAGVTMTFFTPIAGELGSAQTDANGNWMRTGFSPPATPTLCGANPYIVRPSKEGYSFAPASLTFCAASTTLNFTGAPVVTSVSAASYLGQELAQESIIAAFGSNLATKLEVATETPLPTTLAGTTVKVKDSAGAERNAPLFFVSQYQINYQMPPGAALGPATVTVTSGDNNISVGTVTVSQVAPGMFTANSGGQGAPAAAVLRIRNGAQTLEPVARPDFSAIPIDLGPESDVVYLLLYGVGIRNRTKAENISVNLGGVVKTLSPAIFEDGFAVAGFVGLDQVNVLLPRSLAGRGDIDVALTVDGKQSNTVRINVK